MNNILIEEQQFDFLSKEFPRPQGFIRRFQQGNNRFYYTIDTEGKVKLYSSATTLIKDGYAEDTFALEAWRNGLRAEGKNPDYELTYAASRGTLMHALLGDYIQGKPIQITDLHKHFFETHPDIDVPYFNDILNRDSEWLLKAVLAFAQFVKEFNVKPLALELMMKSEKYGVASPIDMICEMDVEEKGFFGEVYANDSKATGAKKGDPKETKRIRRVIAIVDFKSSQKGFYDKHFFQLQLYKRMVEENYPKIEVEKIFNWSPKDWKSSTPTYNLKEQSDGKLEELCETVFEQGRIKHNWKTPTVVLYKPIVDIETYTAEGLVDVVPLKDYLEKHHGESRTEENSK